MKYSIKTKEFCALSSKPALHDWLKLNYPDLHKDLVTHLRSSRSCTENREKMIEILGVIGKTSDGNNTLVSFLSEKFPYVIDIESQRKSTIVKEFSPVFSGHVDGALTFPHRLVMRNTDRATLEIDVAGFCEGHIQCEYIIVNNNAYIEYIPSNYASLCDSIPDSNWMVKAYRKTVK